VKRIALLVLALVMALLVGGGIASASIPSTVGTINGCRKNTDGTLRVIDSAASCPNGWTSLNWAQNPMGELNYLASNFPGPLHFDAGGVNGAAEACPAGWPVVVSGGAEAPTNTPLVLTSTWPIQNYGWQAIWRNTSDQAIDVSVTIHLVCGRVIT
jgi:hypothetical protein